jgi:hypothetical protein
MLKTIYNQKVTILNKLKRADSQGDLDEWHKTVIEDAAWYSQVQRTVYNSSVHIGSYIICLIPYHSEYLDYFEWKKPGNQHGHYTISSGDYLVLGEVSEEITPNNVISVMSNYGSRVCQVKHFEELHDRFGAHVQLRVEGT